MTCIRRNLDTQNCCNQWQKGIRTINNQYPDDNREFEIAAGNGISVVPITAGILITNTSVASSFIEGRNINITPSGTDLQISVTDEPEFDGLTVNGTSTFNGDIIQNGAAYETHAEKIYTTNDYVIMRDGAVAGLAAGDYSGFQVKLYDGANDGRLVIDNAGVARVGDVGDEQPLLTREESADLTNGDIFTWDSANSKAVGISNNFTQGTGNIGSDTKPIKIVNGIATAISKDVLTVDGGTLNRNKPIVFDIDPYNSGIQINANSSNGNNIQIMNVYDNNGQSLLGLYLSYDNINGVRLNASLRNADGTYRYVFIV